MSGTVTASGSVQLPDWVNQAALQNYNTAMGLSKQPYTPYGGTIVAPTTDAQNQAYASINNLQGYTTPYFQQALGDVGQAVGNIQNLGQTTQSLLNPYLGSVESDTVSNIQRAAALQQQQNNAQAQQAGAYGGTRQGIQQATLDSETQRNIGQAINQIQSQGWNTASQLALNQASGMLQGAGALGNLATGGQQAQLQGINAQLTAGSAQQQQQQALLSSQLAQWQQQQNWPYQQLAIAQGALAGSPYGTTATSSQPYSSSTLANALSTGLSALPAIGGLANSIGNLFGGSGSTTGTLTNNFTSTSPTDVPTGTDFSEFGSGSVTPNTISGGDTSSGLFSNVGSFLGDAASSIGSGLSSAWNSVFG